jgi:hypothetical protein
VASDIVPIQLSLTEGDLVTLWAPKWREDGEDWEAFLGDDEAIFGFPEVAQLAAFIRTAPEHDLVDHPAWSEVPSLTVAELTPEESRRFDVIGVPELVAEEPDTWTLGELAEIVEIVRSLADVCDLELVDRILDSTPGFALLDQGTLPFSGREGAKLWMQLAQTVADRWDEVVDALDDMVDTPAVDARALETAEAEAAELAARLAEAEEGLEDPDDIEEADEEAVDEQVAEDEAELVPAGFWEEIGIDPISILSSEGEVLTLRCFLDDEPVFLGSGGRIDVFPTARALRTWIAGEGGEGHDLAEVSTWSEVMTAAVGGDLEIAVAPENTYVFPGLADDLLEGPQAVDPSQLELAVELLLDAADWAGDEVTRDALATSESLGWLVSFVLRPDPNRLTPSPPFQRESTRWRELEDRFLGRLRFP